ncbi:hypothetical protein MMC25_007656 [Agyrium rufum]|nr:hypothetical protein [Agyrium rufum]
MSNNANYTSFFDDDDDENESEAQTPGPTPTDANPFESHETHAASHVDIDPDLLLPNVGPSHSPPDSPHLPPNKRASFQVRQVMQATMKRLAGGASSSEDTGDTRDTATSSKPPTFSLESSAGAPTSVRMNGRSVNRDPSPLNLRPSLPGAWQTEEDFHSSLGQEYYTGERQNGSVGEKGATLMSSPTLPEESNRLSANGHSNGNGSIWNNFDRDIEQGSSAEATQNSTNGNMSRTSHHDVGMNGDMASPFDDADDAGSQAGMDIRAEKILANAKKRLMEMEDNLNRARTSLRAPSLTEKRSSINFSGKDRWKLTAPRKRQDRAKDSESNGHSNNINHARVASESRMLDPTGGERELYRPKRSSSALAHFGPSSNGFGRNRKDANRPSGRVENGTWDPLNRSASLADRRRELLDPLREDDLGLADVAEVETPRSRDTFTSSQDSPRMYPNGHVRNGDWAGGADHDRSSSPSYFDLYQNQDQSSSPHQLARAQSSRQLRDLRDQMQDLKGRISSLRERTREDSMRRSSLQNLNAPSPFTVSPTWVEETKTLEGGDEVVEGDEVKDRAVKWDGDLPKKEGEGTGIVEEGKEEGRSGQDNRASQLTIVGDESEEVEPPLHALAEEKSAEHQVASIPKPGSENHSAIEESVAEGPRDPEEVSYLDEDSQHTILPSTPQKNSSPLIDENVSPIQAAPTPPTPLTPAHEDRPDAFKYTQYFLKSALSSYTNPTSSSTLSLSPNATTAVGNAQTQLDLTLPRRSTQSSSSSTSTTKPFTPITPTIRTEDLSPDGDAARMVDEEGYSPTSSPARTEGSSDAILSSSSLNTSRTSVNKISSSVGTSVATRSPSTSASSPVMTDLIKTPSTYRPNGAPLMNGRDGADIATIKPTPERSPQIKPTITLSPSSTFQIPSTSNPAPTIEPQVQQGQSHLRQNSTSSISTVATFATATENGRGSASSCYSDEDNDEEDQIPSLGIGAFPVSAVSSPKIGYSNGGSGGSGRGSSKASTPSPTAGSKMGSTLGGGGGFSSLSSGQQGSRSRSKTVVPDTNRSKSPVKGILLVQAPPNQNQNQSLSPRSPTGASRHGPSASLNVLTSNGHGNGNGNGNGSTTAYHYNNGNNGNGNGNGSLTPTSPFPFQQRTRASTLTPPSTLTSTSMSSSNLSPILSPRINTNTTNHHPNGGGGTLKSPTSTPITPTGTSGTLLATSPRSATPLSRAANGDFDFGVSDTFSSSASASASGAGMHSRNVSTASAKSGSFSHALSPLTPTMATNLSPSLVPGSELGLASVSDLELELRDLSVLLENLDSQDVTLVRALLGSLGVACEKARLLRERDVESGSVADGSGDGNGSGEGQGRGNGKEAAEVRYERKVWRRRVDGARRVLEGAEGGF